jgi:GNAT superfamily N-acetyltransferase
MERALRSPAASISVERFREELLPDFLQLHSDENDAGWCRCVAWWVPTWDGWGDRSGEDNAAVRASLCRQGEYDGLLAYVQREPVGWCQVGPRDRLAKLVAQLELEPSATTWAVTCFLVAPGWRRRGVAATLLAAAVEHARAAGATRVEGYPRVGAELDDGEAWTGTEALFARAGFALIRAGRPRQVMGLDLVGHAVG